MKKNLHGDFRLGRRKQKILMIMKLSLILTIVLFVSNVQANLSQTAKFTLKLSGVSIEKVFKEIESKSDLKFVYQVDDIERLKKQNLDFSEADIHTILSECLEGSDLEYLIENDYIIIHPVEKIAGELSAIEIKGKVTDSEGTPLPGATIMEKGTLKGVITDVEGNYTITVSGSNSFLEISFIGFDSQTIEVKNQQLINVVLEESTTTLDEVVITGIFTRRADTYTGAASVATAKELKQFGNQNLITTLRNIDPSFNIIESNVFGSNPNRLPEIQIRGNSSIPNVDQLGDETRVALNTPLIILDGFESTLQRLLDMNQDEVESITILKDASATSIYGSRGANGVVVIQSKAPIKGNLRVTYTSNVTLEIPDLSSYNLLNARDKLDLELKVGLYNQPRAEVDFLFKQYYNFLLSEVNAGVDTDWMPIPLRTGVGQRHNLRLEGGDDQFRYSVSAQVNNVQGVMKGSYRNTFNGTINLTYLHKNVKFTNILLITIGNTAESPYGSFSDYVKLNPYWRPYDENGNVNKLLGDPNSIYIVGAVFSNEGLRTNPLYNATLNTFDKTNTTGFTNNTSVEWNISPSLTLRGQLGITKDIMQSDKFRPSDHTAFANYTESQIFRKGDYAYGINNSFKYAGSLNLNYSKLFAEKHNIFVGVDYNIRQSKSSTYNFLAEGFSNAKFDFLSMALQYAEGKKPTGTERLTRAVSLTASANYTYDNRFYLDLSLRTDGSSQFGSKSRFAPFWSTGIGWNIHNEEFLKNNELINRLKVRASVGITGSQNFASYQALSTYRYYTNDRYYNWNGNYMLGLGNKDLKWQQKMNYNWGVEIEMLDRYLCFYANYYIEKTKDLVSSVNLPASSGFSKYIENIGKIENKGFELKATVYLIKNLSNNIRWYFDLGIIHNENKIVEISQAMNDAQKKIKNAKEANPNILYQKGYSTNTIWVVPSLGIDPSNGKEIYVDKDGHSTYTWSAKNLKASGIAEPKYFGNLNSRFNYKSFSINVSFSYRFGGQMYNSTLIDKVENANYKYNVDSRVYDNRWQKPGDNAAFKGLLVTTATNKTSRFVQDENTITCRNINIQYKVTSDKLNKMLGIKTLRLQANVSNLFYFSTIKQERGTSYPFSKEFSFSLTATF
jgi:TonB-linked SusC/RagA family outer membrane protein